jgi:membrane protein
MKILKSIKKGARLLGQTTSEFIDDGGLKLSAALSYYTVFSLPPLLIIIISVCGVFFGREAINGEIFGQINGLVGNDAATQIQEIIKMSICQPAMYSQLFLVLVCC